jgi:peptidyl-tRNA hydrolase
MEATTGLKHQFSTIPMITRFRFGISVMNSKKENNYVLGDWDDAEKQRYQND